ncbi:MAG: glycosyltransferase [Selenomonadaceae bacterium]|nr:glycosyltransferase [Selenomonadaceae bacterium]
MTISKEPVWDTLKDFKGDILVTGAIVDHKNIINIVDILRKEFTLKKPFSPNAEAYRQKILSAECSVSMHFRHGDYAYWPNLTQNGTRPWFNPTPLSYGHACVKVLKELFKNFTVFVFSDNLQWVKENLHLDVPTEFVEGCESATEELILMSLCQNTITPGSSFSKAAAMLNPNPNKKVLQPLYTTAEKAQEYIRALDTSHLIIRNKNFPVMASEDYINVPCDFSDQAEFDIRPYFSLLLVVNNDAATIADTLDSLLAQDYKYYEIIIIDNASTDGSRTICRQKIADKKNVTFKKLHTKVKNAKAWNIALGMAQGYYVSFLKGNDRFTPNTLTTLFFRFMLFGYEILHSFSWLEANDNGDVSFTNEKYSAQRDFKFKEEKRNVILNTDGFDTVKILTNQQINSFLGTKVYNRKFLAENRIKFDKYLSDAEAEIFFQIETFFRAKYLVYAGDAFYIPPKL